MPRKSSRRHSGYSSGEKKCRAHKKCAPVSSSKSSRTTSTHPATGFYSDTTDPSVTAFTYSSCSHTHSKKIVKEDGTETEEYNSTDEYQVDFPVAELKLPRHRRHRHRSGSQMDRAGVYNDLTSSSQTCSYPYTDPPTDVTNYDSLNSQQRFQSIGNIFTGIFGFFQNNPNFTKILLGVILCYMVVCNLEILIPKVISLCVRLIYPWARYWTVVAEQFFSAIANMFTRMDAVIYATYCEFAAKYCRSRRLMCDVTCSFVDHVLSQSRPQLTPVPQN